MGRICLSILLVLRPLVEVMARRLFGLHFGGFVGYSGRANKPQVSSLIFQFIGLGKLPSGNCTVSLNWPPSQMVFSFPGIPHSQFLRSRMPSLLRVGRA